MAPKLKSFLADLCPPAVSRGIRQLRRRNTAEVSDWPTFSSFELALTACASPGYEQNEIVDVVKEKTKIFRDSLKSRNQYIADYSITRSLLVFIYLLQQKGEAAQPYQIIDFGGACGHHYFILKHLLAYLNIKLNWRVVETKAMVQAAKAEFEDHEIMFFDDFNSAARSLEKIDLLFSSGALMFADYPERTSLELLDCGAEFVYFTRMALRSADPKIISIQKSRLKDNGPGDLPQGFVDRQVLYPITFIPRHQFESAIKQRYRILLQFSEGPMYWVNSETIDGSGYFGRRIEK